MTGRSASPGVSNELSPIDLGRLRQLRVVANELRRVLDRIRKGTATARAYASYLETVRTDIPSALGGITVGDDSEAADAVQRLRNVWHQMRINPLLTDPEVELPAQEQLHQLELLDELCGRMVYQTGFLTIPARVNDWLRRARPGYYIPFHAVFDDELPNLEDRTRLLRFLAWSPETLQNGLVDVATGLIYRYSPSVTAQWLSLFWAVVGVIVTGLIVFLSASLGKVVAGWPLVPADAVTLFGGWIALLVGVITHVAVGMAKRAQTQGEFPPILAVGDLPRLINARIGQILYRLFLTLVGIFGLVLTGGIAQVQPLQAFLIGYSLDSVVELFGASAAQRAGANVNALRQQLGMSDQSDSQNR